MALYLIALYPGAALAVLMLLFVALLAFLHYVDKETQARQSPQARALSQALAQFNASQSKRK
jgi:uncharacterized membrane protein affecting hemolysin expression